MSENVTLRGFSRIFLIENRAGPANVPEFLNLSAAGAPSKSFGGITRIEGPSATKRGGYDALDSFRSGEENATLPITLRHTYSASRVLRLARIGCDLDVQVHFGQCSDPRDINGWAPSGKILMYELAQFTDYSISELGSLTSGDEGEINEDVEASAQEFYEVLPMTYAERSSSEVTAEIIKVVVCDTLGCGDCDDPSDGCQKIFAVSAPAGSSPGLIPEVLISTDGLTSIAQESPVSTLAIGEDPDDAACVGDNLVIVSEDSASLHWAATANLILGTETWAEVTTGFVAGGEPRAIYSSTPFDTWIAGAGGYIYFTADPTNGVTVQDAGAATTQSLNDIHAFDRKNIVVVGDSNALVRSTNGGSTWALITGPAVGVNLTAVFMRTVKEWWVGDAGGNLWYTRDEGTTWTQKAFTGDGAGQVDDIVFASDSVGFFSHQTAAPAGRIFRTHTGGWQWNLAPEGNTTLVANDYLSSIAVCEQEPNIVYAGGLSDGGADGILIKGTASYD